MRLGLQTLIYGLLVGSISFPHAAPSQTPPMGWNSYDSQNYNANETEVKAVADTMAKKYLSYGWQYVVVDWAWYYPGTGSGSPNQNWNNANPPVPQYKLHLDSYGRPMPDTVRYPSSVNGAGFKPLADYVHSKGLKFGFHIMRGVFRQAYYANLPVLGTSYHIQDITDATSTCAWLDQTYGLNMNSPGAQAFLNSLLQLFASWGVDFIKVDDLSSPYHTSEIEGYRKAIDSCGREMVLSTSPGPTPLADSANVVSNANQWRMANDMWDNWGNLNSMIDLCASWYRVIGPGHFPDADMIPIGRLSENGPSGGSRYSGLTRTEQFTLMSMWVMERSPLIWGGDLAQNRPAEDSLMTNADAIAIDQNSSNNRPIVVSADTPVWGADSPDSSVKYCALFNRTGSTTTVNVALSNFSKPTWIVTNIWTGANLGSFTTTFSASLPSHGSGLYKLTLPPAPIRNPTKAQSPVNGKASLYDAQGRHLQSATEPASEPQESPTFQRIKKEP